MANQDQTASRKESPPSPGTGSGAELEPPSEASPTLSTTHGGSNLHDDEFFRLPKHSFRLPKRSFRLPKHRTGRKRRRVQTKSSGISSLPTCSTSSSTTTTTSTALTSPSNSSTDDLFEPGDDYPHFKILFTDDSDCVTDIQGIKGVQRVKLIDGKQERPIIVDQAFAKYRADELPDDLQNDKFWIQAKEAIKEVMGYGNLRKDGTEWKLCDQLQTRAEKLSELVKYDKLIGMVKDREVLNIREGFLGQASDRIPLGNAVGCRAMRSIVEICIDVFNTPRRSQWIFLDALNVGGGANGYQGSFSYAFFEKEASAFRSKEAAMNFLAGCKIPRLTKGAKKNPDNLKTRVPDVQLLVDSPLGFNLTAEVTSSGSGQDAIRQTWLQALIGLTESDGPSYALLLTPRLGMILKLDIQQSGEGKLNKTLVTMAESWSFLTFNNEFNADALISFMEAIIDILLKLSVSKEPQS